MARRLSSATQSFAQASYAPLRDSRLSLDSTPEEEDLDPDSIQSQQHRQQPQHIRSNSIGGSSLSERQQKQQRPYTLASDSDGESDGEDTALARTQREGSGESYSTVVAIGSSPDSPPPKYNGRESFEFADSSRREESLGLDPESGWRGTGSDDESEQGLWMQASTTLVIAVSGLICAGWLLDAVQHWNVFMDISELIILIPILLNLKGNLEMNLASRLSTASNMGLLDTPATRNEFIKGNLALLQLQSLTVGSVAGLFSCGLGMIVHSTSNSIEEIALMISSSMLCASISSFVLGSFMCGLVLICRRYRVNPDNIACPLASSFGDLVTLLILSGCAVFLVKYIQTPLCLVLLAILLGLIPVWLYYVRNNKCVSEVVKEGWGPVFSAMVIASTAGLTLERYINLFPGMAMISPVLNGLTGNIGSIYASRISTALHANTTENYRATEKTLFLVHIPMEILFLTVTYVFSLGDVQWSAGVVVGYAIVSLVLVVMALLLAKSITQLFWNRGYDPDNYALPILTSLVDVLGTALLVVGFWILGYGEVAATEFAVEMTCESCVNDVKNVLDGANGIQKYDVNLKEQRVVVEGNAPPSVIARLLKNTGKTVIVRGSGVAQGAHSGAAVCILDINQSDHSKTVLPSSEKPYGLVRFLQVNAETCVVDVTVQNLTPGKHGIHIHELGDTSGGYSTTGGHFNPTNVDHGDFDNGHVGDLGNIEVDEKGWGDLVMESKRIKVWDIIGRSMVVTEQEDDLGRSSAAASAASKVDGNSGKGIICGIIARSAGVFENAKKICDCSGTTLWEEARLMGADKGNDFY
ncbi:hypothetical protein BGZ99_009696 [Dissophora globulifera]|uniref:Superoxide dismutase 1 copper chaperone n=1 Tax=Dissophora globulifera TaxID=979702 RepID=A0A9P6UXS3_9FUNG|nr:hypothetical protein BGZ99_009696 [Dissophora globulifera]